MKTILGLCFFLTAFGVVHVFGGDTEPDFQYAYDAEGRRDPFVAVYGSRNPLPPGAIAVNTCVLSGITRSSSGFMALLAGADRKARMFREGDAIYDAVILSITPEEVVFKQDLRKTDPASVVLFREVHKRLHIENE